MAGSPALWRWCAKWAHGILVAGALACAPPALGRGLPLFPTTAMLATPGENLVLAPMEPHGVVGDTIQMGAMYVVNGRSVSCAPTWASLNPNVATITAAGLLVVRAPGSTTIRATCGRFTTGTTGRFGVRP